MMMMRNQHRARVGTTHGAGFGFDSFALFFFLPILAFQEFRGFWHFGFWLQRPTETRRLLPRPAARGSSIVVAACPRFPGSTE